MSLDNSKSVALYQSISDANEVRDYEMWHASSLAECPRSHYFKRLKVPFVAEAPSAAKMLRWQTGHLMEEAIRPHVAKVWGGKSAVNSNQRFTSKKLQLTGEFDNHAVEGSTLVEIKTVHDWAFVERDGQVSLKQQLKDSEGNPILSKWKKPTYGPMLKPYLHHEIQNHGYVLLMEENKIPVKQIDYVYLSLSGRVVTYTTQVSEKLLEGVKNRLALLNEAWEKQEPPECLCKPESDLWGPVYQWCEYRDEKKGVCCELR